LLVDNRASDLASYDDDRVLDALKALASSPSGLLGSGYTQASYDLLIQQANAAESIAGGVRQGEADDDEYGGSDVRTLMLAFDAVRYDEVVAMLTTMRDALGVGSNSDVVHHLLTQSTS
jgi:hypothetical protein